MYICTQITTTLILNVMSNTVNNTENKVLSPKERWEELKQHIIFEIGMIDEDVEYSVSEPKWWLEMSELQRTVSNLKQ